MDLKGETSRYSLSRDAAFVGAGAALAISAVAGAVVTASGQSAPKVLVGTVVVATAIALARRPSLAATVAIVGCSVYLGIYLRYRISLGGVPLSGLDLLPMLALAGAVGLQPRIVRLPAVAALSVWLLVTGLVVGLVLGVLEHGALYQVLRAARIEVSLLAGLGAGLIAGRNQTWQSAIVKGFCLAAATAAALQIFSFAYQVVLTEPFWSQFQFGADNVASLNNVLATDAVASTRDNFLPTFIMLPALGLFAFRLKSHDNVYVVLLLVAIAVSLSRSLWIAAVVTLLLAIATRAARGGSRTGALTALLVAILVGGVALFSVGGDLLKARIDTSYGTRDGSLTLRRAETQIAWSALSHSETSLVVGLGTGVFLSPLSKSDPSPILENQLLARWTNFGIASVLGALLLLFSSAVVACRSLLFGTDSNTNLMPLAFALPSIGLIGPVSGTLLQLHVTLPFWILAGTVLVAGANTAARSGTSI